MLDGSRRAWRPLPWPGPQVHLPPPGRLAQLGERRLDKAEVAGSSPASPIVRPLEGGLPGGDLQVRPFSETPGRAPQGRSAAIGVILAARIAGWQPASTPTAMPTNGATSTSVVFMTGVQWLPEAIAAVALMPLGGSINGNNPPSAAGNHRWSGHEGATASPWWCSGIIRPRSNRSHRPHELLKRSRHNARS